MDITKEFVNVYERFGIFGLIIAVILSIAGFQFFDFGKKTNTIIVDKFFKKSKRINFEQFIRRLEHIRDYDLKKVKIKCGKRKLMFVDIGASRINNTIKMVKTLKEKNLESINREELAFLFKEEMLSAYDSSTIELFDNGVPEIVVNKITPIENDEVKIFNSLVDNICIYGSGYISRSDKIFIILNFLCTLTGLIIINAESVIDGLNGELDNVPYKKYK